MTERTEIDIIEPRQRAYYLWSPDLIRAAEIQADNGSLRLAADLCEWVFADDRVKAVSDTRTDTLLGLPLSFEGRSKRAVKALDAQEDWWKQFPETEVKLLHTWGIALGVGVAFCAPFVDPSTGRNLRRLKVKNPRNLRFDDEKMQWIFSARDGDRVVTPGDGSWILYTPYGSVRPWVHGAYRALSRWALLKEFARTDWADYSERQAQGTLAATGIKGTRADRKAVADDLRALARKATVALPEGVDLKLVESLARTWETFVAQINAADNGFAVTYLGQNLTTQASGGGANVSMHGKVALGRTKADSETLSTTLHDQHLTIWAEDNYGSPDAAPWPCWDTTPVSDQKEVAAVRQMNAQADATLVGGGIMTTNEARARNGLPPIEGADELKSIEPAPAAPAPAGAPADDAPDDEPPPSKNDQPEPDEPPSEPAPPTKRPPVGDYDDDEEE